MTVSQHHSGTCPHCGEALQIPARLEQFSCLYCGARLTRYGLVSDHPTQILPEISGEACAAYYHTHILETVTNYPRIMKELTQSAYPGAVNRYEDDCGEIFRQLDTAVQLGTASLEDAVEDYLDQLSAHWDSTADWKKNRTVRLEEDKFIIALFMVPMVRRMSLAISEDYCQILQERWCARYPKFPFQLGEYEEIANGFRKKYFGLCFITTAICAAQGKPDDCEELTAFRCFRDGYLRSCADGPELITRYYQIAPAIVLRLETAHDRDTRYEALRRDYLDPCFRDLQQGALASCKDRYVTMVRTLEQEFLN